MSGSNLRKYSTASCGIPKWTTRLRRSAHRRSYFLLWHLIVVFALRYVFRRQSISLPHRDQHVRHLRPELARAESSHCGSVRVPKKIDDAHHKNRESQERGQPPQIACGLSHTKDLLTRWAQAQLTHVMGCGDSSLSVSRHLSKRWFLNGTLEIRNGLYRTPPCHLACLGNHYGVRQRLRQPK